MTLATSLGAAYGRIGAASATKLGFAYVSVSGLDCILSKLHDSSAWRRTRKQWIVGLHRGITEPGALERIRGLPNSSLRVFAGAEHLSLRSLTSGEMFHGKVIGITLKNRPQERPVCLVASSANLTGAALGTHARNYEVGIELCGAGIPTTQFKRFEEWWKDAWSASVGVTDTLLDQYARLRDRFLARNADALTELDPPAPSQLRTAQSMWIAAGAMSGGSRNQVEFNRELASFFGQPRSRTQFLRILANTREWDDRPLAHKITTFGVDIWRLSLPTEASGGFEYPGKVILFRRGADPQGAYFDVDVKAATEAKSRRWRATAHRQGYIGVTSGHREYGFF
jgi:hypothetical protein